ncbi:CDP-diacylglycerol/serine O-phosphatidyltransferase [Nitritalea halalkaliphila LW7]|uniref:CDP-diacylglycerol--serine O-phosphatidyltransferase n=1 Tax=Nitritalea halalkaliphila LW7 TaxID=1189621 RepID=I5C9K5_9BACT|nr:CDP-diacylglycerol--serine O-phosphatidyltransferase [Nitritalea halalkaliphila]EIM78507.1 CDP-diacylglycerol/serine O-phosphatidyltransferase [Nitritalea halalkaliphila LW7]
MSIKRHIPNTVTALNLLTGIIGILTVAGGNYRSGLYFILIAAVFDFLDGFLARILGVHSEIGKQLDSLADMVTFGVLPALILQQFLAASWPEGGYWTYIPFLIGIFSAFRLAKFNIDTRQSDQFIGLPTPANALFMASWPFLVAASPETLAEVLGHPFLLIGIALLFSYLLVAEIPLIALKFKDFGWRQNAFRYAIIALSIPALLIGQAAGFPFIILSYIGLSVAANLRHERKQG